MAWIELHQSLPTHRKTMALMDELAIGTAAAVGHLTCLWLWSLDNAPDGRLGDVKPRAIARAAQWDGDAETFVAALLACGFLDAARRIHDWDAYTGRLIDQRQRNAAKQAAWRERQRSGSEPVTSPDTRTVRNSDVTVMQPLRTAATGPNTTGPDPTQPDLSPNGESTRAPAREAPDAGAPDAPLPTPEPELVSAHLVLVADSVALAPPHSATLGDAPRPVPKVRPRDLIWDALVECCGPPVSARERGKYNLAVKSVRTGSREQGWTDAQAADVLREATANWSHVMGDASMGVIGLTDNLGILTHGPQTNGRSNGTVFGHRQTVTEFAAINRGPPRAGAIGTSAALRELREAAKTEVGNGRLLGS